MWLNEVEIEKLLVWGKENSIKVELKPMQTAHGKENVFDMMNFKFFKINLSDKRYQK